MILMIRIASGEDAGAEVVLFIVIGFFGFTDCLIELKLKIDDAS